MCEYILFFPLNFLHFSTLVGNPSKVRVSLRLFPTLIPNCRESGLAKEIQGGRDIQCLKETDDGGKLLLYLTMKSSDGTIGEG